MQFEAEVVRIKPGYLFATLKVNLSEPNREVKRSFCREEFDELSSTWSGSRKRTT
jgi:hypothetical protein